MAESQDWSEHEDIRETFQDFVSEIQDHRIDRNKKHSVSEILFLTITAMICACDGWRQIERFGQDKIEFLREYFPYQHGTPSDDTLRLFFRSLDPAAAKAFLHRWAMSLNIDSTGRPTIAIDGKVLRGSHDGEESPLHLVTAYMSEHRIVLSQESVDKKSNEITAVPKLLEALSIERAIVTIDAMGCQKEIARQIQEKKGDYILALKGNQGTLYEDTKLLFTKEEVLAQYKLETEETTDKGHGRLEHRKIRSITIPKVLKEQHANWEGLESLIEIESTRTIKGLSTQEKRYYISSLKPEPGLMLKTIRNHWAIENSLHHVLDVTFREDDSRIRKKNAPKNMAIIRHMTLNLLQMEKKTTKTRDSLIILRKRSGWNEDALRRILGHLHFI